MSKYISTTVKKPSLFEQIVAVLRRGPCTPTQISQRTGIGSSNISGVCYKHPDVFEKVEEQQIGQKKPIFYWKLKNPE